LLAEQEMMEAETSKAVPVKTASKAAPPEEDNFDDEMEAMAEMDGMWWWRGSKGLAFGKIVWTHWVALGFRGKNTFYESNDHFWSQYIVCWIHTSWKIKNRMYEWVEKNGGYAIATRVIEPAHDRVL